MADEPAATPDVPAPAPDEGPDPEGSRIESIDTLREKIDRILGMLEGDGKPPAAEADPVEAAAERAVAKVRAAEDRKKAAAERRGELEGLKATVKKLTEKPPLEVRKAARFLFGDPENPA